MRFLGTTATAVLLLVLAVAPAANAIVVPLADVNGGVLLTATAEAQGQGTQDSPPPDQIQLIGVAPGAIFPFNDMAEVTASAGGASATGNATLNVTMQTDTGGGLTRFSFNGTATATASAGSVGTRSNPSEGGAESSWLLGMVFSGNRFECSVGRDRHDQQSTRW